MPNSAANRRIDVTDFGADPTGIRDSAPAIIAALAAARAHDGPVTVEFPAGRYDIWPEAAERRELYVSNTVGDDPRFRMKTIGILIDGIDDLRLDGNGSSLIFHGVQTTLAVIDSHRVTVSGLTVDFAVPTVIDATVTDAGVRHGRAFRVLSVPACTPYRIDGSHVVWHGETSPQGAEYWSGTDGLDYTQVHDPREQRTYRVDHNPLFDAVASIDDLGGGRLSIDYLTDEVPTDAGLVYQMRRTTRDHPGMLVLESSDVTLSRSTVHFLHGFGLVAQLSRDVTIDHVTFQTPADSGRSSAGFADFLQFSAVAGDVVIRSCTFDGPHDDPVNIHGTYLRVIGSPDARSLEVEYRHAETAGFPQFFAGDEVAIIDADSLSPAGEPLTVAAVSGPSGRDGRHPLRRMTVEFTEPLAPALRSSQSALRSLVVENLTLAPRVTISDNVFRNVPTRGVLVTSRRRVLIEGNTFDRVTMPSIYVSGDAQEWYESGAVRNLTISRNEFIDPAIPAILVAPTQPVLDPARPVHRGIVVRHNRFRGVRGTIVDARSVAGLRFHDNDVAPAAVGRAIPSPAIRLRGSTDAVVDTERIPGEFTAAIESD